MTEDYYTASQAAELLKLNYHTLLARARRGEIPSEKFGWSVMFKKETIDAITVEGSARPLLRDID